MPVDTPVRALHGDYEGALLKEGEVLGAAGAQGGRAGAGVLHGAARGIEGCAGAR